MSLKIMRSLLLLAAIFGLSTASTLVRMLRDVNETITNPRSDFNGSLWAVLVAGSYTYDNYRHQADVFHAYQILTSHGFLKENIIVMAYDDIAYSSQNPTPGIVINRLNGPNVYENVTINYHGDNVTAKNFLNLLTGSEELKQHGGKVLESGPDDHVFVYFADHGAVNIIGFPEDYLYATQLNAALKLMHSKKMYSKLVFYMEACESGSMFSHKLSADLNIYAVTASNPLESSYACYWDDVRETYLGDVFSVNWLENSDSLKTLTGETLNRQFKIVKQATSTSHVSEYGDLTWDNLTLAEFQGESISPSVSLPILGGNDAVPSEEVPLWIARNKVLNAITSGASHEKIAELSKKLIKMMDGRDFADKAINQIATLLGNSIHLGAKNLLQKSGKEVKNDNCYEKLVDTFNKYCFNISRNTYLLSKLHLFANICEHVDLHDFTTLQQFYTTLSNECINSQYSANAYDRIV